MRLPGEMNLQALALLGNLPGAGGEAAALATRMFDTDGDGRNDLFVVDFDGDGTVDGVVRGLDADGDGVSDTFIEYNGDGEIQAIGRVDPESREFEVTYRDADEFEDLASSFGLADLSAPDEALFTTFDDAFFTDSFGTQGEEVPEEPADADVYAEAEISEVDEGDLESLETGKNQTESDLPEVTPRVVEIEDYSGAEDGSDLHARVDRDGDGLGEDDERLSRTSDGTWHGDVNKDGYSEEVAFDRDQDGRIESVDTTGRGSSTDVVGAEHVVSAESGNIVDRRPGEDDVKAGAEPTADAAEASAEEWQVTDADGDAGGPAVDSDAGTGLDPDDDTSSSNVDSAPADNDDSADDSGSSYDSGSTASSVDDDSDAGSTTTDSGPSDSGGTDTD
jgi:hypothetical protein